MIKNEQFVIKSQERFCSQMFLNLEKNKYIESHWPFLYFFAKFNDLGQSSTQKKQKPFSGGDQLSFIFPYRGKERRKT